MIAGGSTFQQVGELAFTGNWTNGGTYTNGNSTVTLTGLGAQYVDNASQAFFTLVSSNTSAAGVTLANSLSATNFLINASALGAGATVYVAAGSTLTVTNLFVSGTPSNAVVLRSNVDGTFWYLNNVSSNVVSNIDVKDSNASAGQTIYDIPGGVDSGHNVNWIFDAIPPLASPTFLAVNLSSITAQWGSVPPAVSYTLLISTNGNYADPLTSSSTALTQSTTDQLLFNTTYFFKVASVVNSTLSSYLDLGSTSTLANVPAAPLNPWSEVDTTSITVNWLSNGNPLPQTLYSVELNTAFDFSGTAVTSATFNVSAVFSNLLPGVTYYGRVLAINNNAISTAYASLGSTTTLIVPTPQNISYVAASTNTLTVSWTEIQPSADSYQLSVSTAIDFTGTLTSSTTVLPPSTVGLDTPLLVNTTYYARVKATINSVDSDWSTPAVSTATLADVPATVASTWTAVDITSITVAWDNGANPALVTHYDVQIGTASDFTGSVLSATTDNLNATFLNLVPDTIYYGRVQAINHSGIPTAFLVLGSTRTDKTPAPSLFAYTTASTGSLTATWDVVSPTADNYTVEVSTANDFSGVLTSSMSVLPPATVGVDVPLLINTTYYGRIKSTINGSDSDWSLSVATATLADVPVTAASTWSAVDVLSFSVQWSQGNNPDGTLFEVRIGTDSLFTGVELSSMTLNESAAYNNLIPNTIYYGRVRAINHSNIPTAFISLGSTQTVKTPTPTGLVFSSVAVTNVTAQWDPILLAADLYTLQVSTANDFTGLITSSSTEDTTAVAGLDTPLIPNTTYYGRVDATIKGVDSDWSAAADTVTLANAPAVAVPTWVAVNFTSVTVQWDSNGNPLASTLYEIDLSTAVSFDGSLDQSSMTFNTSFSFTELTDETSYYARAKAINQSGISTVYTLLGSTVTQTIAGVNRIWTGAISTDWQDPSNWNPFGQPFRDDNITIPLVANQPVLTGTSTIHNITLDVGTTLTVQGATFTVRGSVQSNGTLSLSSTEILNLPNNAWDLDSGTVSYEGVGSFTGLTAGTSYYNLRFNNAASDWTLNGPLVVNGSLALDQGALAAAANQITVSGDARLTSGWFQAGTSLVDLNGSGAVSGFTGANAFYDLNIAASALTTTLASDILVAHQILFGGGVVSESGGARELAVSSALSSAIVVTPGTEMQFSTLTWTTSNTSAIVPEFAGYPALNLESNVAGQNSVFTLAGDVVASTVSVYNVASASNTTLDLTDARLRATSVQLGFSSVMGRGDVHVGNGVLDVAQDIRFANPSSVFDLGTSTAVNVGGDFLYGGSTGTFVAGTSTLTFVGAGPQRIDVMGGALATVFTRNTSFSGVTFMSSFSVVNLNAVNLAASTTFYFAANTAVDVTGRLDLEGSAGRYVVLRSTLAGVSSQLSVFTGAITVNYADVKDNDASGGQQIIAFNSIDSGNNHNWDFGPPATVTLTATAGPALRDITLSWPAPGDDGATGAPLVGSYYVQYSTNPSVIWSTASAQIIISTSGVTTGSIVSTVVSPLVLGTTYYFRQISVDDVSRFSGYSNVASLKLNDVIAPDAITNLVAAHTLNEGEIALQWTAPDGDAGAEFGQVVASYQLRYSTISVLNLLGNTTAWWNQAIATSSVAVPSAPGVTEHLLIEAPDYGVTYYYAIRSVDPSGNISQIDTKAASPAAQANAYGLDFVPPAVGNLQAVGSQSQATITWNPVNIPDFWKYQLYRGLSPAALSLAVEFTASTQSAYIDLGLVNGATYFYEMVTVDKGAPAYPGVALTSATAIVAAVTAQQQPNAPVISSTNTISQNIFSIRWAWDQVTPPQTDGFRVYVSSIDISNALPNTTTMYTQINLLPNQAVIAQVGAFNNAGTALSNPFTRYVLANPPVNSVVTSVSDFNINLGWGTNGNVGSPTYQVVYALNNSFTNATTVQATLSQITLNNLLPQTPYFIHIRALNGDGIPTSFDVTLSTMTNKQSDITPPAPPGGMWADGGHSNGNGTATFTISWDAVMRNADGTTLNDLAGYIVKTSNSLWMPEETWLGTPISSTFTAVTINTSSETYVAVRAVDTSGNQSLSSAIILLPDVKYYAVADDRESWYEYTHDMAGELRAKWAGNKNVSYLILGNEFVEHYTNGKIIKSVRFRAYEADTMTSVTDRAFQEANGQVHIVYSVVNGNIVQGTPDRDNYFQSILDGSQTSLRSANVMIADNGNGDKAVRTKGALDRVGTVVMPNNGVSKKISMFWNNGVDWIKLGGDVDQNAQVVTVQTSRLGSYQLREASQLGDASLVQVYPRIITPNGDGANDVAIFQFGELTLDLGSLSGEIFDITGAKVAPLKPGPDPNSTLMWDGKSSYGSVVPAGIYIYQIYANGTRVNGTVVVAR